MKAGIITTAAIAAVLVSGHISLPAYGQTPPKPDGTAVVVASEAGAVVESVDKQARQVLLHLPDDTLLTLTVPLDVKTIDKLKPGDHVAVTYYDAAVIHLAKTEASATEKPASGESTKGQIQGVIPTREKNHSSTLASRPG